MMKLGKRTITLGIVLALALVAFAAPAYAFFTNVLSASGNHDIKLGYRSSITEDPTGDNESDCVKNITMTNEGDTEIMVRVYISGIEDAPEGVAVTVADPSNAWSKPANKDGFYEYKYRLQPGDKTEVLKVRANTAKTDSEDAYDSFSIMVVGQTSPVAYDKDNKAYAYEWSK